MLNNYLFLYTDPGTGAMVWQLLVAAGLGAAFYFRHYIARARALFSGKKSQSREED